MGTHLPRVIRSAQRNYFGHLSYRAKSIHKRFWKTPQKYRLDRYSVLQKQFHRIKNSLPKTKKGNIIVLFINYSTCTFMYAHIFF